MVSKLAYVNENRNQEDVLGVGWADNYMGNFKVKKLDWLGLEKKLVKNYLNSIISIAMLLPLFVTLLIIRNIFIHNYPDDTDYVFFMSLISALLAMIYLQQVDQKNAI